MKFFGFACAALICSTSAFGFTGLDAQSESGATASAEGDASSCFNFSGNWEGQCVYNKGIDGGEAKSELKIEQEHCSKIEIDGQFYSFGGRKTTIDYSPGERVVSSHDVWIDWSADKRVIDIRNKSAVSYKDDDSQNMTGSGSQRLVIMVDGKLQHKASFLLTSYSGVETLTEMLCTYKKK